MTPDLIYLKAMIRHAEMIPKDALSHLGCISIYGLFRLSKVPRRCFFDGIAAMFGYTTASHKKGMNLILKVSDLDYEDQSEVIKEANLLRQKVSVSVEQQMAVRYFYGALQKAASLRAYLNNYLIAGEPDWQDIADSMYDGTTYVKGGAIYVKVENNDLLAPVVTAPRESVGSMVDQEQALPFYDAEARELRVGSTVLRRYNRHNFHEIILTAFQEVGWRQRIPVPQHLISYADRLQETIDQMNTPQTGKPMLIRFRRHGRYILWEWRYA